jgi:hypothetical protein
MGLDPYQLCGCHRALFLAAHVLVCWGIYYCYEESCNQMMSKLYLHFWVMKAPKMEEEKFSIST